MKVYIAGTDITDYADVTACKYVDAGTGESDRIEITFGASEDFLSWKPRAGEKIRITDEGIDTGYMPIALEMPGSGAYTVIAAAMPDAAARREWAAYQSTTIGDIMRRIAGDTGDECAVWGINTKYAIKYAVRLNESMPEFIARMLTAQAGLIKWQSGRICAAGLEWLTARDTVCNIELRTDGANFDYTASDISRVGAVSVISPYGKGIAQGDTGAGVMTITDAPVFSGAEALMWANGALKLNNLGAETLEVSLDLNPNIYAWGMYETTGPYTGRWLAARVEHDLKNRRTSVTLER